MSDESKKDIVAHYAYRTFWAGMRAPVFLRAPLAFVALGCCAVKIVECTIEEMKDRKSKPDMAAAVEAGDPFAGAFNED